MDTAQWPQIVVKPIEEIVVTKPASSNNNNNLERKLARPQKEQALNCPRCNSTNTKFCYYNNYSLTQPRYFCKGCRRYWTEGGSLRNIPVGGGSRKNKRSSSSSATPTSTSSSPSSKITRLPDLVHSHHHHQKIINHQGQDLNLGFPLANTTTTTTTTTSPSSSQDFRSISDLVQLPNINTENKNNNISGSSTSSTTASTSTPSHQLSALELLTGLTSRGFSSFMPMPAMVPDPNTTSGFSLPEFKPSLSFSLDGLGSGGYGGLHSVQETGNGRLLFPFEDLKQVSSTTSNGIHEQNNSKEQGDSAGYWTGMLGGGSW